MPIFKVKVGLTVEREVFALHKTDAVNEVIATFTDNPSSSTRP